MDEFERESEAYAGLQRLMDDAKAAKTLFERAGLPIPAPLARMLGDGRSGSGIHGAITVPPIEEPERPPGVGPDWLWVCVRNAITITLVKSLLGRSDVALRPKDVVDQVIKIRPDLSTGGIYNSATPLERAGLLTRETDGWLRTTGWVAPVLNGKFVWGSVESLQKQEVAWHRRQLILHMLSVYRTGLQVLQIVENLQKMPQCKSPVSKDLVKADMEVLQEEKKVKRAGASKKWVLT
jgi:hypothetical protein